MHLDIWDYLTFAAFFVPGVEWLVETHRAVFRGRRVEKTNLPFSDLSLPEVMRNC
jgi:hypothetical protein